MQYIFLSFLKKNLSLILVMALIFLMPYDNCIAMEQRAKKERSFTTSQQKTITLSQRYFQGTGDANALIQQFNNEAWAHFSRLPPPEVIPTCLTLPFPLRPYPTHSHPTHPYPSITTPQNDDFLVAFSSPPEIRGFPNNLLLTEKDKKILEYTFDTYEAVSPIPRRHFFENRIWEFLRKTNDLSQLTTITLEEALIEKLTAYAEAIKNAQQEPVLSSPLVKLARGALNRYMKEKLQPPTLKRKRVAFSPPPNR